MVKPPKLPSQPMSPLLPLPTISFITALTAAIHSRLQPDPPFFPSSCEPLSAFFSVAMPSISTHEYVERLVRYADCSNSAFVLMLIYIDRVIQSGSIQFVRHSMHRVLLAALTVAVKNTDDIAASSTHYARVGGVPTVAEMNRLELLFLTNMQYKCFVAPEQYAAYVSQLQLFVPLTYAAHNTKAPDLLNSLARVCRRDQTQLVPFQSCRMSYNL
ncbi:Cyclin [Gracilaria domingensis]|nr:Cyclin [Gracilaria domingensis]